MAIVNPTFQPHVDYNPSVIRVGDIIMIVMIPQDKYPDINFAGLLIGPRGNTVQAMERETGAKIVIRGNGLLKGAKMSRIDGPLCAHVIGNNPEYVQKAVNKIKEIIKQGIEPEGPNVFQRMQLRELAILNDILEENNGPSHSNCSTADLAFRMVCGLERHRRMRVIIPRSEHPKINFVGLLIGPRGNTIRAMEKETGAKIIIRGIGVLKEERIALRDGQPLPVEDGLLCAYVTGNKPDYVQKAVNKIEEIIKQAIEAPEGQNDLQRKQLRELATLNGTLRENDRPRRFNRGAADQKSWICPDKPNFTNSILSTQFGGAAHIAKDCGMKDTGGASFPGSQYKNKTDEDYMPLMAKLGKDQLPSKYSDYLMLPSISNRNGGLFNEPLKPPMSTPPPRIIPNSLPSTSQVESANE